MPKQQRNRAHRGRPIDNLRKGSGENELDSLPRPRDATHVTALRYFHEVARYGSIRAASERLNVASSAISRQIAKLEAEMGMPLFERQLRGMILTQAGLIYDRYVRDALLSLRRVRSEIGHIRGLRHGHIRINTIEGLVAAFLSSAISDFWRRWPGLTFEVRITSADDVMASVSAGEADIGLAFNAPPRSDVDFVARIPDPVRAVVAAEHPMARRTSVSLIEVLDEPLALPVTTFGIRNLMDQAARETGLVLTPALLTNSIEALRAFARNGDGVALLHNLAIERELTAGSVVAIPIDAAALNSGSVDVCVLSERMLPVAALEFLRYLEDRFGVLVAQG